MGRARQAGRQASARRAARLLHDAGGSGRGIRRRAGHRRNAGRADAGASQPRHCDPLPQRRPSAALAARVFAQCWMPFGHRQQICCEQIEITASDASLPDLAAGGAAADRAGPARDSLVPQPAPLPFAGVRAVGRRSRKRWCSIARHFRDPARGPAGNRAPRRCGTPARRSLLDPAHPLARADRADFRKPRAIDEPAAGFRYPDCAPRQPARLPRPITWPPGWWTVWPRLAHTRVWSSAPMAASRPGGSAWWSFAPRDKPDAIASIALAEGARGGGAGLAVW